MTRTLVILLALAPAGVAHARDVTLKPLGEARLRYEQVDQDGLAADADALTLRLRAGVEAKAGRWSALVEGQGTLAVVDDYFDGLHGPATRPLVADPENIALARAQLRYASPSFAVTAGRQRIGLDDERFIGAVPFRQNGQSFDAVRAEITPAKGVKADLTYAWSVRTIWGIDGAGARQQAVSGDNLFGNVSVATPVGKIAAFAYLVDQDEAAMQGFRMSSQSYGVRLDGSQPLGKAKIAYQLSYARQSDWHRNPNDYSADYWLADVAVDLGGPRVGGGGVFSPPAPPQRVGPDQFPDPARDRVQISGLGRQIPRHSARWRPRPLWQRGLGLEGGRAAQGRDAAGRVSRLSQ